VCVIRDLFITIRLAVHHYSHAEKMPYSYQMRDKEFIEVPIWQNTGGVTVEESCLCGVCYKRFRSGGDMLTVGVPIQVRIPTLVIFVMVICPAKVV
jgi:hypothetical protein